MKLGLSDVISNTALWLDQRAASYTSAWHVQKLSLLADVLLARHSRLFQDMIKDVSANALSSISKCWSNNCFHQAEDYYRSNTMYLRQFCI
eukprot:1148781-Pelagomonas_calceolata.AAC.2